MIQGDASVQLVGGVWRKTVGGNFQPTTVVSKDWVLGTGRKSMAETNVRSGEFDFRDTVVVRQRLVVNRVNETCS